MNLLESPPQTLMTMPRRQGWLKRFGFPALTMLPEDEGLVLDKRWRKWVGGESTRRLINYVVGDQQLSRS
jgi:hypothetical protein